MFPFSPPVRRQLPRSTPFFWVGGRGGFPKKERKIRKTPHPPKPSLALYLFFFFPSPPGWTQRFEAPILPPLTDKGGLLGPFPPTSLLSSIGKMMFEKKKEKKIRFRGGEFSPVDVWVGNLDGMPLIRSPPYFFFFFGSPTRIFSNLVCRVERSPADTEGEAG